MIGAVFDPTQRTALAAATLSVIVGGPAETFAASEDLFRAMGKNVFHGPPGTSAGGVWLLPASAGVTAKAALWAGQ